MTAIDDSGRIIRKESEDTLAMSEMKAQRRKEIAEVLCNGGSIEGNMIFESIVRFEESDPQIAVLSSKSGPVALVYLETGTIEFYWGYQYHISNSFETGTPTDEIFARCNDIISVLMRLEETFSELSQLKFDVDNSEQRIFDWSQISDWLSKCPIKYKKRQMLTVT